MKIWHEIWEYVKMIIIVVAVVLVINNVVLINAKIPSPSMEKTIMTGDRIFGFRLAYGINLDLFGQEISYKVKDPERFDIVIFKYPDDESQLFIKRVIGLPGETVEIKDGKVYIDGSETALDDSFIPEKMQGSFGPYTVPDDCYFMLGDNRNNSKDSRYWVNTFVRFDQIVGKAVVRYYPSIKLLGMRSRNIWQPGTAEASGVVALEDLVNRTNEQYRDKGLALVQKIPTPITPVRMDKENRHITLAYFDQRSTVDYIGAVQGIPVCFDAKECNAETFPLANIHPHQVRFMEDFEKQNGVAFFLIFFSQHNLFYYLPFRELMKFWKRMERGRPQKFSKG